ncbi:MAG: 16S rRNA (uracil(1498)-N(3))-methyltransferase [Beijerinckiaceae bacterium]|nr:16S rRNA (uracil(1498)-N(3))-methyltransferase [Beijerinckiaceae bacterium]
MARYDFNAQRLFVEADLAGGAHVELTREQANYLMNVLRLGEGDFVHVFNGRDGEWRAGVAPRSRRDAGLAVTDLVRPQEPACDLHYLFAPLKHARLDYMIQKAVEMGASRLTPVITRRTQAARVNTERMRANAIEAAEQCGVLTIPEVDEPVKLERLVADWSREQAARGRRLVFCDEDAATGDPVAALRAACPLNAGGASPPLAVLVGPEGGFDPAERRDLAALPGALVISLGPRILRADTAAVAALAIVQAALGDWR